MRGIRNWYFLAIIIFLTFTGRAQIIQPAVWNYSVSQQDIKIGEELDLIFRANIDPDWYMYSSDFECEVGPIVTAFEFQPSDHYSLVGNLRPINAEKKYDEIFECEYTYFKKTAEFRQTIKILKPGVKITGTYEYQVCTDVDGKCISFDDEFTIDNIAVATPESNATQENQPPDNPVKSNEIQNQAESNQEEANNPVIENQDSGNEESAVDTTITATAGVDTTDNIKQKIEGAEFSKVKMEPFYGKNYEKPKVSYIFFMLAAFLAGFAALLTPCVFPMIPMTVSFFTGGRQQAKSNKGQALFYGFCIILIYTLIGALVSPIMGPETANDLSTEWLPNLIFFAVFFIFSLSFFGMFDIVMPSSLVNSMDQRADKGGWLGVFFMAFTLVLVSFSCTGPIVSTILVESAGGQVVKPILGMLSFSMAFAIPFTLFAFFPKWLNSLPKSGGWLNSVKVVLGFIELALAFKFLSIADQAFHWGILDREVNIAIWVVIFGLMGFYLLGKIRLPHDSELKHIGVPRLILAICTLSFVVYLIPGMFGAPLKALAGYLPPMYTHDFDVAGLIRENEETEEDLYYDNCDEPKYADFLHLPHGLKGYFDLEQALACARVQNKPVFVDFTGHGCTNCREMEAVVWSDPLVLKKLKEEFIVVALYVDDKTELPENEWYISSYDNKLKKTIGKQNADLQIQRANANAQPNYFLIGKDEKALTEPIAYSNVDEFLNFLNDGLSNFKTENQVAVTQ